MTEQITIENFQSMEQRIGVEDLLKAFGYGIDYGLLLAEQERDSEDLFDAVGCYAHSRKMCLPSTPAPRRQPRSVEWRQAKYDSYHAFIKLLFGDWSEEP